MKNFTSKLRGKLSIFVDGYKVCDKCLVHVLSDGKRTVSVHDRLVPPPTHEVGSMEWFLDGWGVGDNLRNRLCGRLGNKALKQFDSYDAAVDFAYRRQQKHKQHRHILVYFTKTANGQERRDVVRSMDDILAIEADIDQDLAALAARNTAFQAEHPHLKILQAQFGMSKAYALSLLIKRIQDNGVEAAKEGVSKATFSRHMKNLRDAGLV